MDYFYTVLTTCFYKEVSEFFYFFGCLFFLGNLSKQYIKYIMCQEEYILTQSEGIIYIIHCISRSCRIQCAKNELDT